MKELILVSTLFFSASVFAARTPLPTCTPLLQAELPSEVSAVLITPDFSQLLQHWETVTRQRGETLRVVGYLVTRRPVSKVVFTLATKISADLAAPWQLFGEITARVEANMVGQNYMTSLYFTPTAEAP